jgi:hypothetical protein
VVGSEAGSEGRRSVSETKRTAGPWVVNGFGGDFKVVARMDGHGVAVCSRAPIGDEIEDARFIVRACNSHDDLVAALEAVHARRIAWPAEIEAAVVAALLKAESPRE